MAIDGINLGKSYNDFAIRTGAAGQKAYQEQFVVLPDSWRELANKPNKTEAEFTRLDTEYKEGFIKFGKSYIDYLDKKFGNDDGELTIDEYVKSQMDPLSDELKNDAEFIQATINSFNNLNIDGGRTINAREMTALLSLFDMDVNNGGLNGKVKAYDTMAYSLNLFNDPETEDGKQIQKKIAKRYISIFSK